MHKVIGSFLSLVLVLSIVGAPKIKIGTDNLSHKASLNSEQTAANYPSEPPDPMEWFLPKFIAPPYTAPVMSQTTPETFKNDTSQETAWTANIKEWNQIKQELDRKREEIKQERVRVLARIKEGISKIRKESH